MSEFQYYEFQSIDRPLTDKEMNELRAVSTRARITPTGFVNDYAWGSFKGNADAWMENYFDAFLYLANWGTHILKLRLPSRLLDPKTAIAYCGGGSASAREKDGKVILSFTSDDEEGGEWIEGEGHLTSLIGVRSELDRGDQRALYLGWLLRVQTGELYDEETEPAVPPGLDQLSASLENLAEFLRIDNDLLAIAAESSVPLPCIESKRDEIRTWVAGLPVAEKDDIITRLIVDADQTSVAELFQRFLKESSLDTAGTKARRTVAELLEATRVYAGERRRIEVEQRAKAQARREREKAAARAKHLDQIAGREAAIWAEVDALIATKKPQLYDQAIELLIDLRDLDARIDGGDFQNRMAALRHGHARKYTLMERFKNSRL